jgi:ketosteroid isomerase-like protein
MSGRASGIDNHFPVTNIYDLANGRIRRVRVFMDRDAALEAAGLSE